MTDAHAGQHLGQSGHHQSDHGPRCGHRLLRRRWHRASSATSRTTTSPASRRRPRSTSRPRVPPADTTAPTLVQQHTADNATNVAAIANIVFTFNEAVQAGTGNIEIHKVSDNSIVKSIAVTDGSQVTFAGSQITSTRRRILPPDTGYYVTMASGVVLDLANNAFVGSPRRPNSTSPPRARLLIRPRRHWKAQRRSTMPQELRLGRISSSPSARRFNRARALS